MQPLSDNAAKAVGIVEPHPAPHIDQHRLQRGNQLVVGQFARDI
ncbi:hypothetical protein [Roseibacillus ishigakijimensis]|nr:hypothetical protein [Roseibacillus ishigakijimensis]